MAEPLGIVASVIQVASAGLKLSQTLYQYANSVAYADRRIKDVAREIQLTAFVIEELGCLFRQDATSTLLSKNALRTADETVRECSEVFSKIDKTLKKSERGTFGRLALPFREPKIELLRSHVDKLKSTLQLLMQVLTYTHQVAAQKLDREAQVQQRQQIKALLQEKNESVKRYEESFREYSMDRDNSSPDESSDRATPNQSMANKMVIDAAGLRSRITTKSLATCVQQIKGLLSVIETLQQALTRQEHGTDHSEHHQNLIESYSQARKHLDDLLLGNVLEHIEDHVDVQAAPRIARAKRSKKAPGRAHLQNRARTVQHEGADNTDSSEDFGARSFSRNIRYTAASEPEQSSKHQRDSAVEVDRADTTGGVVLIELGRCEDTQHKVTMDKRGDRRRLGCFTLGPVKREPIKRGAGKRGAGRARQSKTKHSKTDSSSEGAATVQRQSSKGVYSRCVTPLDLEEDDQRKVSESDEEVDVLLREWTTLV